MMSAPKDELMNMEYWISCQVGERQIFQVQHYTKECRMIKIELDDSFSARIMQSYPGQGRNYPSLVNVKDKQFYLIGGQAGTKLKSVLRYDLKFN